MMEKQWMQISVEYVASLAPDNFGLDVDQNQPNDKLKNHRVITLHRNQNFMILSWINLAKKIGANLRYAKISPLPG